MSDGNLSSISLSSESSTWRDKLKMFKQRRDSKPAPVLQFSSPTPPLPAQTPSPTAKDYQRIDEASIIDSYHKPDQPLQSPLATPRRNRPLSPSTMSMREPLSSKECLQRAKFLKERAHDYLQESRALLDRASIMAFEEAEKSHDKARRREEWARKAKKHADKLEHIIIK